MKRLLALVSIVAFALNVHAQIVDPQLVPDAVKKNFAERFAGITPNGWSQDEPGFLETTFYKDKHRIVAMFAMSGTWISTDTYLKETEFPQKADSLMKSSFPDGKIVSMDKSETTKGVIYESEVKSKGNKYDFTFNADGKLLTKDLEKE